MSQIFNSDAYKIARKLLKDRDKLLSNLSLAEQLLTPFKAYFHVAKCLKQVKDSKDMLFIQIQSAEKVISSKGRIK